MAEKTLTQNSITHATSSKEFQGGVSVHKSFNPSMREFYYSSSFSKRRRLETSKRRFKNKIAFKERKFCSSNPLMFIRDRGHGIGSKIRGRQRFGGHWKEKLHARNATVFTTNKHNNSQTCHYCYGKFTHPRK
jgi:hypothetical protein